MGVHRIVLRTAVHHVVVSELDLRCVMHIIMHHRHVSKAKTEVFTRIINELSGKRMSQVIIWTRVPV
jgi:hypothetical protein